jgi:hypothetical protein
MIESEHPHALVHIMGDERLVGPERVRILEADQHGDLVPGVNALEVRCIARECQTLGIGRHELADPPELGVDFAPACSDSFSRVWSSRRLNREGDCCHAAGDELVDRHLRGAVRRPINRRRCRHEDIGVRVEWFGGGVNRAHAIWCRRDADLRRRRRKHQGGEKHRH